MKELEQSKQVTGDAVIRPGEKFAEDALAQTCEALRVELAAKKQTINELTARLADWAAMNSECVTLRMWKAGVLRACGLE